MNNELTPASGINAKASRRVIGALGALLTLSATSFRKEANIAEGTVFKKQHVEYNVATMYAVKGVIPFNRSEIDTQEVGMPYSHKEDGLDRNTFNSLQFPKSRSDEWKVYLAQCPSDNLPTMDKIEKECRTNWFSVPQEVFQATKLGEHVDFKSRK
jgi:hypothetical protein